MIEIIGSAVVVGLLVVIYYMGKAMRRLLYTNDLLSESNEGYDLYFVQMQRRLKDAFERVKSIDKSGHFEADDEVGYFFKELKSLIEGIYEMGIIDEQAEKEAEARQKELNLTAQELEIILDKRRREEMYRQRNAQIGPITTEETGQK